MAEEDADAAIKAQKEAVKAAKFKLTSKIVKTKKGKKAIKLTWKTGTDLEFDGYAVYRSNKKNSGYGKKPIFTTTKKTYTNTAVKAGKTYYYRVRGFVTIDGEKVYTQYSTKAWRTIK
jgi:fibronectin type 3 domain-containing protein